MGCEQIKFAKNDISENMPPADEQAQAAKEHFQIIFEQAPAGLLQIAPSGKILHANQHFCTLIGYSENELQNITLAELSTDTPARADQIAIAQLLTGERKTYTCEQRYHCKNQQECWIHMTLAPAYLASSSQPEYLIAIVEDISERKRLEETLHETRLKAAENNNKLAATFSSIAEGVFIYDAQARVIQVNAAARDLLSLNQSQEKVTPDKSLQLQLHDKKGNRLTEDEEPIMRVLQGEVLTESEDINVLVKALDKREIELNVSGTPIYNAEQQTIGGVLVFRDITEQRSLEKELLNQAQEMEAVFETITDALLIYDLQGKVIRINSATRSMLEVKDEQVLFNMTAEEWNAAFNLRGQSGKPVERFDWPIQRLLRGEIISSNHTTDMILRTLAGNDILVNVSGAPIRSNEGKIVGAVLALRNIAERKALEQELESRVNQLEATFEAIGDGVCVYNSKSEILTVNKAARSILGIKQESEQRLSSTRAIDRSLNIRNERGEPLSRSQWPIYRVLNGETLTGSHTVDVRLRTFDGREILTNVSGAAFNTTDEKIGGVVLVFRDVTERRQLELRTHEALSTVLKMAEALVQVPDDLTVEIKHTPLVAREVIQRLADLTRSVMGNRRVGIVSIDAKTQQLQPIAFVGIDPNQEQEWLGKLTRLQLDNQMLETQLISRLRANEVLIINTHENQPQPLKEIDKYTDMPLAILAPMYTDNRLIGILALDYDQPEPQYTQEDLAIAKAVAKLAALVVEREHLLTEREESRAHMLALHETNQRMDKFISIASHELKTPITTMKGYVQLMARKIKSSVNAPTIQEQKLSLEKMVERMEIQIDRLIRLENDLLDVSRIKADQLDLHFENCDLTEIVRGIVEDQSLMNTERDIQLEIESEDGLSVQADAERIGQVVTNYLSNALKYSPPHKPVTVHLHTEGTHAYVSVTDQGPGLPTEEHKRIWDNFYRVKDIEIQSGSGVGLGVGLHICRTIVEQHQGQYGIQSTPGQGSTFWFRIPISEAEAENLQASKQNR